MAASLIIIVWDRMATSRIVTEWDRMATRHSATGWKRMATSRFVMDTYPCRVVARRTRHVVSWIRRATRYHMVPAFSGTPALRCGIGEARARAQRGGSARGGSSE